VVVFFLKMVPMVNQPCKPAPYLAYGKDRMRLLLRILKRIEETSKLNGTDPRETILTFFRNWFHVDKTPSIPSDESNLAPLSVPIRQESSMPLLSASSSLLSTTSSSPSVKDHEDKDYGYSIPSSTQSNTKAASGTPSFTLYKEDMDYFLAWAFFAKGYSDMLSWERKELKKMYQLLEKRHNLTFPRKTHDTSHLFHPRRMTLEPVVPFYRPLIVYLGILCMKWVGAMVLKYVYGFEQYVTKHGMSCWYRPAKRASDSPSNLENDYLMPILFFHGIAPGGVVGYLPLVLYGLATESDRPVFLFENMSISCVLDFYPLTEKQTVDGVLETLKYFGANKQNLSLVGHSFGSCPIAWLLSSKKLDQQIQQMVLLDPVAILLSEPDVMVNFLYAEEFDKTRIVASSEIMTQSYLRRHFAWYNSELYVEDVKCPMLVFCSEQDEIVNSAKAKQETQRHHQKGHQFFCWEGVGHGACIVNPNKWKVIKRRMLQQELQLAKAK